MKVTFPIRAVNASNTHEHRMVVAKRAKAQRQGVAMVIAVGWPLDARKAFIADGATVTLTRIAPRELDDDGNVTSLKAVRDGVADAFGLPNDRDPRVRWMYAQRRGGVRQYAVEVEVEVDRG